MMKKDNNRIHKYNEEKVTIRQNMKLFKPFDESN